MTDPVVGFSRFHGYVLNIRTVSKITSSRTDSAPKILEVGLVTDRPQGWRVRGKAHLLCLDLIVRRFPQ